MFSLQVIFYVGERGVRVLTEKAPPPGRAENSYGAQRGQAGGRGKFKFKFKFNPASMGLRLNWSLSLSLAALNLNLNVNFSRQTLRSAVATPAHAHTERLKNGFTERLKNALKTLYRTH